MKAITPKSLKFMYGTAWKTQQTKACVQLAFEHGFRAFDTACQLRHYDEAQVGEALSPFYSGFRDEFFLQTKFTPANGHDLKDIPYKLDDKLCNQVLQSFETSLRNLKVSKIDSYVLHSPYENFKHTLEVWNAMCALKSEGKVRYVGISNIYSLQMLKDIIQESKSKPDFIQNRFYNDTWYDVELRQYLTSNNIVYQSFWTLTANPFALALMQRMLRKEEYQVSMKQHTKETAWYFYLSYFLGIVPIIGTTNVNHMKLDVHALSELSPADERFFNELQFVLHKVNPSLVNNYSFESSLKNHRKK